MQLIVITPDISATGETTVVNRLFEIGLQRLHLRKPGFTRAHYERYLAEVDNRWHSRIVIHDGFDLYHQYQLGGVHLNSFMRADSSVWKQVNGIPTSAISTSFHSWEEVDRNAFPYGYVFISPVFNSISKAGYKAGIDLTELRYIKERFAKAKKYLPGIVGLGGVTADELGMLSANRFDGAAMLGGLWQEEDPMAVFITAQTTASQL